MSRAAFADQIEDPDFRRLHAYWSAHRYGRFAPRRADLQTEAFGSLLGDLILLEVQGEPARFHFRVHGTRLAERAGYDMTGRYADQLPLQENRAWMLQRCQSVCGNRRPEYGLHDRIVDYRRWRYEVLWLPLSADGSRVDMLLGALRYRDTPETARPLHPEERAELASQV